MRRAPWKVAPLLFASGLCALVYQVAWQREFRLVFGASTAASAAVLAIFIGGLGAGGLLLGKRADAHPAPLLYYARLEAAVGGFAAATPLLLGAARWAYVRLGGTVALGLGVGTALRLVLAAVVLAVPTLAMGGTLPAAARSVQAAADPRRRAVALLYAANTVGAVAGALLATFVLLERLGTRASLWTAAALNLAVAGVAALVARRLGAGDVAEIDEAAEPADAAPAPRALVLVAAGVVGFAFFLMELVWYRMLAPLLGGSVFTFGLILAVALLGIGLGGLAYALFGAQRPARLGGFASTCLLEAALVALPFAAGDHVALLTILVRPASGSALGAHLAGWAAITALVVLPASFVAGVQYPMLIALLGRGRRDVGRDVGLVAAVNTAGAMAGSLAGGFGLLPLLGAIGCWRAAAALLGVLGLAALGLAIQTGRSAPKRTPGPLAIAVAAAAAIGAAAALSSTGPTSAWRHSPIGAGRVDPLHAATPNFFRHFLHEERRAVFWERDGVESSVALDKSDAYAFLVNGKVDGNARGDAATQVMGGLLAAFLHPAPRRAMVIGLGTGSSAGWLGAIPAMERVDVAELEPAILDVARACAPVNHGALDNPRVHVAIGDARETLLTTRERYDVIFSEPSNPYRAGIASLFTVEYYRAASARLAEHGLFAQWVQAYEIDAQTIRTIIATLGEVFPSVETWRLGASDLLLVASASPPAHDADALRARLREEPYAEAVRVAWRTTELEGVLAHHVAQARVAAEITAAEGGRVNTDDLNRVEFGFARHVGRLDLGVDAVEGRARAEGLDRPAITGEVDWARVRDERLLATSGEGGEPEVSEGMSAAEIARARAQINWVAGNPEGALTQWRAQEREPRGPTELCLVAEGMAEAGDEGALPVIERLRALEPVEADYALARLRAKQGKLDEAARALEAALSAYRRDPWPSPQVMQRALVLLRDVAAKDASLSPRLYAALREPFAVRALDDARTAALLELVADLPSKEACVEAWTALEPHVPWLEDQLLARRDCYRAAGHPLGDKSADDMELFAVCSGERPPLRCWR